MNTAPSHAAPPRPPEPVRPEAGHTGGASPIHLRGLLTGFALSVLLTALAFWLVMAQVFTTPGATVSAVLALAVLQIGVHMVCFLHLDTRSEGGWNLLALLFTGVLVLILLIGSLWVMYHLKLNMMPTHARTPPQMQAQAPQA